MPSNRRLKATGLIAILTILVILYVFNGAKNTQTSAFYTRTAQAMHNRQNTESHEAMLAGEKARAERVAKVKQEHEGAMRVDGTGESQKLDKQKPILGDMEEAAGEGAKTVKDAARVGGNNVKENVKDAAREGGKKVKENVKDAAHEGAKKIKETAEHATKAVGGRKMVPSDGRVVINEKADGYDGVAKVGNVDLKESNTAKAGDDDEDDSEEQEKVDEEMNLILKKGPIIVFSKSHCPHSKKAKHILLDLYTISPPPYVVELDHHPLGPGLQTALLKTTGRKTVPNVLINGRSIGGGDDVQELHTTGKLAETIRSMGGKRIMEVTANLSHNKREVSFRS